MDLMSIAQLTCATKRMRNRLEGKGHMPLLTVHFRHFVQTRKTKEETGAKIMKLTAIVEYKRIMDDAELCNQIYF
jgi:hypothetical protein